MFRAVSASRRGGSFANEDSLLKLLESSTNLNSYFGISIYIMPFSYTYTYIDSHYNCKDSRCQSFLQVICQEVIHTLSAHPGRSPHPLSIGYGRWCALALLHRSTTETSPSEGGMGESRLFSSLFIGMILLIIYLCSTWSISILIFFSCVRQLKKKSTIVLKADLHL